jgi:hypothetical protein
MILAQEEPIRREEFDNSGAGKQQNTKIESWIP